jgi:ribosomal protein S18 acetylase RimI-like enzyme
MTEVTLRPLDPTETADWATRIAAAHTDLRASFGLPPQASFLDQAVRERPADAPVFGIMAGDERVGSLALRTVNDREGVTTLVDDLTIDPAYRRRGYGREALALAMDWARKHSVLIAVSVDAEDPAATALARDIPARAQHMVKVFAGKPELPQGAVVRPMRTEEYQAWRSSAIEGYAADIAGSGLMTIEDARVASATQTDQLLPDGLATDGMTIEVVEHDGAPAGFVWLKHGYPADGVSFVFSVEVDPALRGKGLGKAAMLAAEHTAIDRGSSAMMLNVFAQNDVAIGLYRRLGYRVLAQYRTLRVTA